jgi:hypothetical protein
MDYNDCMPDQSQGLQFGSWQQLWR